MPWLPEDQFQAALAQKRRQSRLDHQKYLRSSHWIAFRKAAILNAGSRCQFKSVVEISDYSGFSSRCEHTGRLDVHHLHYDSLWNEKFSDVEVLCRFHHLIRELMKLECLRCRECVFDSKDDAICFLEGYCDQDDDEEVRALELDGLIDDASDLCPYCDHMCNKDD